jgi:outer membrane protein
VKTTILSITFLLAALPLFAQTGSSTKQEVTLEEAINLALKKNYTSRTASLDLEHAELEKTRASDNLLPSVDASGSWTYSQQITKSPLFDTTLTVSGYGTPAARHSASYNVGGLFNIYNGGSDASNIESSSRSLDAAKYNLKWTRQVVALDVVRSYVNALRTRELLASADKTLEQTKAQLDRVTGLYQAGSVPVGQVYQQEATMGQQELQRITAQNDYDNAKADLLFVLNVPANAYERYDITVRGIDTSASVLKTRTTTIIPQDTEVETVIANREDFATTRSQILASEAARGITKAALLPRLDANFGVRGSGVDFHIDPLQIFNSYYGGLSASWTLFDKMQDRIRLEQQDIEIETQRVKLEEQEQQYRSDIAKAMNAVRNADLAVGAAERGLRAAEESLRSAEERFRVGAGTQTDVIVAQATIQQARASDVNAIYTLLYAQKVLEYQLGRWNY